MEFNTRHGCLQGLQFVEEIQNLGGGCVLPWPVFRSMCLNKYGLTIVFLVHWKCFLNACTTFLFFSEANFYVHTCQRESQKKGGLAEELEKGCVLACVLLCV
jgi:hypothetical protein